MERSVNKSSHDIFLCVALHVEEGVVTSLSFFEKETDGTLENSLFSSTRRKIKSCLPVSGFMKKLTQKVFLTLRGVAEEINSKTINLTEAALMEVINNTDKLIRKKIENARESRMDRFLFFRM